MSLPEQGQAGEAARSSRDVLPEAGSLSDALRLGHREHHGGHLNSHAGPRRPRLGQRKRGCVAAAVPRSVSRPTSVRFPWHAPPRPFSTCQANPAALTEGHRSPGGTRNVSAPSTISPATLQPSNLPRSQSARCSNRFDCRRRDTGSAVSITSCCLERKDHSFFQDVLPSCWSARLDATSFHAFSSGGRILSRLLHDTLVA